VANQHKVHKLQFENANLVMEGLQKAISPEFIGLISTSGHPISVISSTGIADSDVLAALSAGSFAAARQLCGIFGSQADTTMLQESNRFNIHITQVTDDALLVVCCRKAGDIGRVRLITRWAAKALAKALEPERSNSGAD